MNQLSSIFSRPSVRLISEAAIADLGPGMHPRISIKGTRFTLIDAGGVKFPWPNLTLLVVIVGANPHKSKVYYEGAFDPDAAVPPTCFSDNGVAASINATRKMARSCAECELGAWGSDTSALTGKGTKACHDKKKLAVVVIGDTTGLTYELQIPPASLKNLNKYASFVASHTCPDGSRKADLSDMVTGLAFMPDQVGILDFQPVAWIDSVGPDGQLASGPDGNPVTAPDGGAAIAARLDEIWESNVVDELVGLNDVPWAGAQTASALPAGTPAYLEAQGHGRALQRGPHPASPAGIPGFAGPPDAQQAQPQQVFSAQASPPAAPQPGRRGGARPGAGRPKTGQGTITHPTQEAHEQTMFNTHPTKAAQDMPLIPPFLRNKAPGNVQYGMTDAPPPPTGIQEAVNKAFSLDMRRTQ